MANIFLVSDWHFNHQREFIYEPRGFKSLWEHDEALIVRHNEVVKPEDEVYFLGDAMMGQDHSYGLSCIRRLNGNIHMIRGNHDTEQRWHEYSSLYNVVELCDYGWMGKLGGQRLFLSHFPTISAEWGMKPLKNSVINVCGHRHTRNKWYDEDKGMIYHVEVDAHDGYPTALEDLMADFRKRVSAF